MDQRAFTAELFRCLSPPPPPSSEDSEELDFFESDMDAVDSLNFGKAGEEPEDEFGPCLLFALTSLEVPSSRDTFVTESLGRPSIMSLSLLFSLINLTLLLLLLLLLPLLLLVMLEPEPDEDFRLFPLPPPLH